MPTWAHTVGGPILNRVPTRKHANRLRIAGRFEGPEAARQKAIMNQLQLRVFEPANDTHLLPVREMEATGQLLEGRNRKRADEITKAEAALAQIAKERTALK